jgi:hypothetical protein
LKKAVYMAIFLWFLRRLLRKVLVPMPLRDDPTAVFYAVDDAAKRVYICGVAVMSGRTWNGMTSVSIGKAAMYARDRGYGVFPGWDYDGEDGKLNVKTAACRFMMKEKGQRRVLEAVSKCRKCL